MGPRKLYQVARSLMFRRRMAETMENLEQEIKASLSEQKKKEIISGDFKISVRENGHIEISELPSLNLEQLKLPLKGPVEPKGE